MGRQVGEETEAEISRGKASLREAVLYRAWNFKEVKGHDQAEALEWSVQKQQ